MHIPAEPLPPEVILSRRRKFRYVKKSLLEQLILRDGLVCSMCGYGFKNRLDPLLSIDHKKHLSKGGNFELLSNLQLLCRKCHDYKDNSPVTGWPVFNMLGF